MEMSGVPLRTVTMTTSEMKSLVKWGTMEGDKEHPINNLISTIKVYIHMISSMHYF